MTEVERNELFNSHYYLALDIIKQFTQHKDIETEDLKQEALAELWKITLMYDKSKGKFSTFAYTAIRNHLCTYVNGYKYGGMSRSSFLHTAKKAIRLSKTSEASLDSICDDLQFTSYQKLSTAVISNIDKGILSFEQPLSRSCLEKAGFSPEHTKMTLGTAIYDHENSHLESRVIARVCHAQLMQALYYDFLNRYEDQNTRVNKKLRRTLGKYYLDYIFSRTTLSQKELAEELGVTRQFVSKYYVKFKKQLKKFIMDNNLIDYPHAI